jgi:hypothetical protein
MSKHCLAWLRVGKGKFKLIKLLNMLKRFVGRRDLKYCIDYIDLKYIASDRFVEHLSLT